MAPSVQNVAAPFGRQMSCINRPPYATGIHVPGPAPVLQPDPGPAFEHRLTVHVLPTLAEFSGVASAVQIDAAFGQSTLDAQGVSQTAGVEEAHRDKNGSPETHHCPQLQSASDWQPRTAYSVAEHAPPSSPPVVEPEDVVLVLVVVELAPEPVVRLSVDPPPLAALLVDPVEPEFEVGEITPVVVMEAPPVSLDAEPDEDENVPDVAPPDWFSLEEEKQPPPRPPAKAAAKNGRNARGDRRMEFIESKKSAKDKPTIPLDLLRGGRRFVPLFVISHRQLQLCVLRLHDPNRH